MTKYVLYASHAQAISKYSGLLKLVCARVQFCSENIIFINSDSPRACTLPGTYSVNVGKAYGRVCEAKQTVSR